MRVEESITIGELSRRTGVNIETIRYFERVGVLATPPRPRCARSCLLAVLRRRHAVRSARSRLTI